MWIHLLWSQRPWPYSTHMQKGHDIHLSKGKTHKLSRWLERNEGELNLKKKFQVTFNSNVFPERKNVSNYILYPFFINSRLPHPFPKLSAAHIHIHGLCFGSAAQVILASDFSKSWMVVEPASPPPSLALHSTNSVLRGHRENSNSLPFLPSWAGGAEQYQNYPVCWGQQKGDSSVEFFLKVLRN